MTWMLSQQTRHWWTPSARALFALFALFTLTTTACGGDPAGSTDNLNCIGGVCPDCTDDDDCPTGESCVVGFCTASNNDDNDDNDAGVEEDDAVVVNNDTPEDVGDDVAEEDGGDLADAGDDVTEDDGGSIADAGDDDVTEDDGGGLADTGDMTDADDMTDVEPDAPGCADDDLEPNNRPAEAEVLTVARDNALTLCADDEDWFTIRAELLEILTLTIDTDASLNIDLIDFVDGRTVIDSAVATPEGYALSFRAEVPGNFFVRVTSAESVDADYGLRFDIERVLCEDDEREDDDRIAFSTDLAPEDTPLAGTLCAGDEDWFAVEIPGNFQIDVTMDFVDEDITGVIRVGLYDANEELIAQTNAELRTFSYLVDRDEGGTYFLRVDGQNTQGDYTLTVALSLTQCDPDANEPNDTADDATGAEDEVPITEQVLCPNDVDWFSVEVGANLTVRAELALEDLEADVNVDVIGPDQVSIISRDVSDGDLRIAEAITAQSGTHYLRVFSETSDRSPYTLLVNVDPCVVDEFEPNNSPDDPIAEPFPGLNYDNLRICDQDTDWFRVDDVLNTEVVRLEMTLGQGEGDLLVRWYLDGDLDGDPDSGEDNPLREDVVSGDVSLEFGPDPEQLPFDAGAVLFAISGDTRERAYTLLTNVVDPNACEDDAFEPNDDFPDPDAPPVRPGLYEGLTICEGDFDRFCTEVPPRQTITVTASFNHAEGDLELQLTDTIGIPLAASATDQDVEEVTFTNNSDDPLRACAFVAAQFFDLDTTNTYDLRINVTGVVLECEDDPLENNDDAANATLLQDRRSTPQRPIPDGRIFSNPADRPAINTLRGLVRCASDLDLFTFRGEAGDELEVNLSFAHDDGDLGLRVFSGQNLIPIGEADTQTDDETLTLTLPSNGEFFISVDGRDGDGTLYDLDVALRGACVEDEGEPNDLPDNATPIEPGSYDGLGLCANEEDWYALTLNAGDTLEASIFYNAFRLDMDFDLYGPDQQLIARSNNNVGQEALTFTALSAGTYTLRVFPFENDGVGASVTYDLDLTVTPEPEECTPDLYEPNDELAQRLPLSGAFAEFPNLTLCRDDVDTFTFLLLEPEDLNITVTIPTTVPQSQVSLSVPGVDTPILGTPVLGGRTIDLDGAPQGFYTLRVSRGDGGTIQATYNISLTLSDEACAADRYEPNDAPNLPALGGEGSFKGLTLCGEEQDCYGVDAELGEQLTAQIAFDQRQGNLRLDLFNPDLQPVAFSDGIGNTERVSVQALRSGRHVVCVQGQDNAAEHRYDLRVEATSGCADDLLEPNDGPLLAQDFPVDGTFQGQLCGDEDWTRISTLAGQRLDVFLSFDTDNANLDLVIMDDNMVLFDESRNEDANEFIDRFLTESGDLFIGVVSDVPTQAPYDLRVALSDPVGGCIDDGNEPDDLPDEATPLVSNTLVEASLCDGADFYSVTGLRNEEIVVEATTLLSAGQVAIDIFDSAGRNLLQTGTPRYNTTRVSRTPTANETLLVRVRPLNGYRDRYTLKLMPGGVARVCLDDLNEPDDVPLFIGAGQSERVGAICGEDTDRYAMTLQAGEALEIVLDFPDGVGDLDMTLLDPNNQFVGVGQSSVLRRSKEIIGLDVNVTGLYTLLVTGADPDQQAAYTLKTRAGAPSACVDDDLEENDDFNTARELPVGLSTDQSACSGDEDWFFVTLQAGEILEIDLAYQTGGGDVELELLNDGRALLRGSHNLDGRERLVFTNGQRETLYFVRVAIPGRGVAPYDMDATITTP